MRRSAAPLVALALAACEPDAAELFGPATPVVASRAAPILEPPLELWVDPLVPGAAITLQADGAPAGAEIVFVVGRTGAPRCPAFLAGTCVNLRSPAELGRATADATGLATIVVPLSAAAAEGNWLVLQAAEPGGGWTSDVVVRRVDPEPIPTQDYEDLFEPNTVAPARLVPGYYAALALDPADSDEWADRFVVAAAPNRTVRWQVRFFTPSEAPSGAGPAGDYAAVETVAAGIEFEVVSSSLTAGDHHLLIGGDEYSANQSLYTARVVIEDGPPVDWYPDADGDGAGDPAAAPTLAVDPPLAGWVANAGDCDDADPALGPDAPDVCGDGVAQDCVADTPCAPAYGTLVDADDVGSQLVGERPFGLGGLTGGDLDGDGIAELVVGDEAGGVTVFAGPIAASGDPTDAVGTVSGELDDGFGPAVVVLGDVNGDGLGDLAVSGPGVDAGAQNTGGLAVVYGPVVGDLDVYDAPVRLWGDADDALGGDLAGVGDVNGDGLDDLLVLASSWADHDGVIYLVTTPFPASGPVDQAAALILDGSLDLGLHGGLDGVGDVDGDGVPDWLALDDAGVALFDGSLVGAVGTSAASGHLLPPTSYLRDADGVGDVDGDGVPDVLVAGDPGSVDVAFLYLGPFVGDRTSPDATLVSSDPAETDGELVDGPGDVDGDGFVDLLVASAGSSAYQGVAWVVSGPVSGVVSVEQTGVDLGWGQGAIAAGVGDIDGDGRPDIAVARDLSVQYPWGAELLTGVTVLTGF